jgi:hypothetical protein
MDSFPLAPRPPLVIEIESVDKNNRQNTAVEVTLLGQNFDFFFDSFFIPNFNSQDFFRMILSL